MIRLYVELLFLYADHYTREEMNMMGAAFGMYLNMDNFQENPALLSQIIETSLTEYNRTMCQLCLAHVLLDLDQSKGVYRFIKLHQAVGVYFHFLDHEVNLNEQKEAVKVVFYIMMALSFIGTIFTVNWYANKYTNKKPKERPMTHEEE